MTEKNGGKGKALSDTGRRTKADEYVNNKSNGQPQSGLGTTRGASAGTPKAQADLGRKGSRKA